MTGWVVLFAVLGVVVCLLLFVIWQLFGVRRAPRPKLPESQADLIRGSWPRAVRS